MRRAVAEAECRGDEPEGEAQLRRQREYLKEVIRQGKSSLARTSDDIKAGETHYHSATRSREASERRVETSRDAYSKGQIGLDRYLAAITQLGEPGSRRPSTMPFTPRCSPRWTRPAARCWSPRGSSSPGPRRRTTWPPLRSTTTRPARRRTTPRPRTKSRCPRANRRAPSGSGSSRRQVRDRRAGREDQADLRGPGTDRDRSRAGPSPLRREPGRARRRRGWGACESVLKRQN